MSLCFFPLNLSPSKNVLVQNMTVRKFRVGGTLEDELVIMFMADYHLQIDAAKAEFEKDLESNDASSKTKHINSNLFGEKWKALSGLSHTESVTYIALSLDRFRDTVTNPKFTDVVISRNALQNSIAFSENEIRSVRLGKSKHIIVPDTSV